MRCLPRCLDVLTTPVQLGLIKILAGPHRGAPQNQSATTSSIKSQTVAGLWCAFLGGPGPCLVLTSTTWVLGAGHGRRLNADCHREKLHSGIFTSGENY